VLVIRALVQAAEAAGVSAGDVFFAAGFDGRRLMDARENISADEHRALVEAAIELTGDPAFGLHAAERSTYAAFGVTSQLLAYAPSLRAAIGARRRFHRLLVDEPDLALVESSETAAVQLLLASDLGSARYAHYNAEFAMVSVLRSTSSSASARRSCMPRASTSCWRSRSAPSPLATRNSIRTG
jgi:hypothetical protein